MTQRIVVRVANAQGVSERRPQDEAHDALTKEGRYGTPDVVLFSEISWLDLPQTAARHGFHAVQHGDKGSPEAGVGIASREPLTDWRIVVGSRAVPGVRTRPLVSARAYGVKWTAGHAPPPRTPVARALYLARLRSIGGICGLDSNQRPAWMRRTFARKYRGAGVLGLLIPRRIRCRPAAVVEIGSDHPAVDVVMWI